MESDGEFHFLIYYRFTKKYFNCQIFNNSNLIILFSILCLSSTLTTAVSYKALQIKRRQIWLSSTRTAITYHIQIVCILQYWSPVRWWLHSDMYRCLFCLAWLWLIPCPPQSYAQCLAAPLHLWTTPPGLVWGIRDKQFFVSNIWWLCKCYIMTRCHKQVYFNWNACWHLLKAV